jgi:uncharacterized protein (TIGR00290 family)
MAAALFWSGGKDSALSLYILQQQKKETACLVTSYDPESFEVGIHKVPLSLIEAQAQKVNIPLVLMPVCDKGLEIYNQAFLQTLQTLRSQGITTVVFGDIHLQDIRNYKEEMAREASLRAYFPLWDSNPTKICRQLRSLGFRSLVICVNLKYLSASLLGKNLEETFEALPLGVDRAGEYGEYHTFVYAAPYFKEEIRFEPVGIYEFCKLVRTKEGESWEDNFAYLKIESNSRSDFGVKA